MTDNNFKINNDIISKSTNHYNPRLLVRIAIYDNLRSIPRIIDLGFNDINNLINETSQKTYNLSHEIGGRIPYTIIREIIENLIHADFREVVITILSNGNHIIVSDQGPGIEDKEKAFLPGYTSATRKMKEYIRGVGSGFPIVKETITFSGGSINVEDNVKKGTVISLKLSQSAKTTDSQTGGVQLSEVEASQSKPEENTPSEAPGKFDDIVLSDRQQKILFIILELEEAGPSKIANELGFSLSTSYRELIHLEKNKLLISSGSGKRKLSKRGIKYLEYYSNNI